MTKVETGSLYQISVYWLKKNGYLLKNSETFGSCQWKNRWNNTIFNVWIKVSTKPPEPYINLSYTHQVQEDQKEDVNYNVLLETTPCYFGGRRFWFTCPLTVNEQECSRRVGVLYKVGRYFGCRHCHNLTYSTCNRSGIFKKMSTFSFPELEQMRKDLRTRYYNGKPTRNFMTYQKKMWRLSNDFQVMANYLYK